VSIFVDFTAFELKNGSMKLLEAPVEAAFA
jgi:hypothetical protein